MSDNVSDSGPISMPAPGLYLRLQKLSEHGARKAAAGDFEYAIEMFQQCVQGDPSNLGYLQSYLDVLRKKYNNNKRGDKMAGLKGSGLRSQVRKALAKKDWNSALTTGAEMLKLNPWDLPTLQAMAEACERLGYDECQLAYLRNAIDANPKDVELNRQCAKALTKRGLFDQAITCWHRVEQAKPYDEEAGKAIGDLSIERTVNKGNAAQVIKKDANERKTVEVSLTPEQTLQQAILKNPADLDKYLELARLYQASDKLDRAETTLEKGLAASGGDLRFREALEEIHLAYAQRRVAVAERRAKESPTPENREIYKKVKAESNLKELDIYRARVERYPRQEQPRFAMAVRLKKAGSYAEASAVFQELMAHSQHPGLAQIELGECQQHLKQYQPALESFYHASKALADSHPEGYKFALYRAGTLALGMKNVAVAEKILHRLAERDPQYRDLPDLLDKLAALRHKG
ncbi:MAG TPA: hypothetical protein VFE24_12420 [Pirellulales bacterium]|jgi:thioredoxin-like negative regulator of GroEL|nr:hypothetical protein [Pirellulales bacterium]